MNAPSRKPGFRLVYLAPLALFAALAGIFFMRIGTGDPSLIPSALIGRPAPDFALQAPPQSGVPGLSSADLKGKGVTLVNVFASWCVPCRQEHPVLMEMARDSRFRLVGLNYKDQTANALRFLNEGGNPYAAIGEDTAGRTGIDFGVYGVPETFVIDKAGVIRYKFVGPLTMESFQNTLLPEVLKAAS